MERKLAGRYEELVHEWPDDVPFERVFRQRLEVVDELQRIGVTWSSIASAMARAGITQRNGRPLTGRQLSAVYLRSRQHVRSSVSTGQVQSRSAAIPAAGRNPDAAGAIPAPRGRGEELARRLADARQLNKAPSTQYEE